MLDTYHVPSSDFRMVHAGEVAVEAAMIAFAQEKVKEAVETIKTAIQDSVKAHCDDHTPFYGPCLSCGRYENTLELPEEDEVLELVSNSYSLDNIK